MKEYQSKMKVKNTILNLEDTEEKLKQWKIANGYNKDAPCSNLGDFSAKLDEDAKNDENFEK